MARIPNLLMVDDDDEDIYLTRRAFCSCEENLVFSSVYSGEEMFDFLYRRGDYKDRSAEFPDVILLDINLPKEKGFAVLEKLRKDNNFGLIPVVMLTTSTAAHDIQKAYQLGASSYMRKSASSEDMRQGAKHFCDYWFGFAQLPKVA